MIGHKGIMHNDYGEFGNHENVVDEGGGTDIDDHYGVCIGFLVKLLITYCRDIPAISVLYFWYFLEIMEIMVDISWELEIMVDISWELEIMIMTKTALKPEHQRRCDKSQQESNKTTAHS